MSIRLDARSRPSHHRTQGILAFSDAQKCMCIRCHCLCTSCHTFTSPVSDVVTLRQRSTSSHVVLKVWICASCDLEGFVAAGSCGRTTTRSNRMSVELDRSSDYSSSVNSPEMMAFVEAIAGIIRLTTPCVRLHVTPSILY